MGSMKTEAEIAITAHGVSKTFRLPHEKHMSVKNAVVNFYRHNRSFERQQVLKNISFDVKKGEFFGIVGRNGSGKSTLLKLLAGIYSTDSGTIDIKGKLTPFIELGVGFNPELTGRENVFLNGALLGFNRKEMIAMYDDIVAFSELERFMDQKLKNYSSGMQVRLAFSIAIQVNSDILLLDEVLAVGDAAFQKKCFDFFRKLKKDKKTVIFISHDMTAVREYCDRALLIENGEIISAGTADKVAKEYTRMFTVKTEKTTSTPAGKRWGTGEADITKVTTLVHDKEVKIDVEYYFKQPIDHPILGITITSPVGVRIFESNTKWQHIDTGVQAKGNRLQLSWEIPNIFTNGTNYVSAAVANEDATEFYDWWDEAATFIIDKDEVTSAVTLVAHNVRINKNVD
jgi:ABC-2 type transport system ATP-binding protein